MEHKLHLYTGDGKGKTTAAMGLALRALGHGQRVLVAQFLKDGRSGELSALKQLAGAVVWQSTPMQGFLFAMDEEALSATRKAQTAMALALAAEVSSAQYHLVVLDELAPALAYGVVEEAAARSLLHTALAKSETVVTGRDAPAWLREAADYMSEIAATKHPYQTEGLAAREGVEW